MGSRCACLQTELSQPPPPPNLHNVTWLSRSSDWHTQHSKSTQLNYILVPFTWNLLRKDRMIAEEECLPVSELWQILNTFRKYQSQKRQCHVKGMNTFLGSSTSYSRLHFSKLFEWIQIFGQTKNLKVWEIQKLTFPKI